MSRRSKGPRLWLRPARHDTSGNLTHEPAWFILDGTGQRSTGLGIGASEVEKEKALNDYLTEKHTADVSVGSRDPSQILVADVLAKYVRDKVADVAGEEDRDETGDAKPECGEIPLLALEVIPRCR